MVHWPLLDSAWIWRCSSHHGTPYHWNDNGENHEAIQRFSNHNNFCIRCGGHGLHLSLASFDNFIPSFAISEPQSLHVETGLEKTHEMGNLISAKWVEKVHRIQDENCVPNCSLSRRLPWFILALYRMVSGLWESNKILCHIHRQIVCLVMRNDHCLYSSCILRAAHMSMMVKGKLVLWRALHGLQPWFSATLSSVCVISVRNSSQYHNLHRWINPKMTCLMWQNNKADGLDDDWV